jgi:hypothetical protein
VPRDQSRLRHRSAGRIAHRSNDCAYVLLGMQRLSTALGYSRIYGANDRVRVGYIGVGNRGDQVHEAFLEHGDQETVDVSDLRSDYMDFAVKKSRIPRSIRSTGASSRTRTSTPS